MVCSLMGAWFVLAFGTLFVSPWANGDWTSVATFAWFAVVAVAVAAAYPASRWRHTRRPIYLIAAVAFAAVIVLAATVAALD